MYTDGFRRYLEFQKQQNSIADILTNPNAGEIMRQYRENALPAIEEQRKKQAESLTRGQSLIERANLNEIVQQAQKDRSATYDIAHGQLPFVSNAQAFQNAQRQTGLDDTLNQIMGNNVLTDTGRVEAAQQAFGNLLSVPAIPQNPTVQDIVTAYQQAYANNNLAAQRATEAVSANKQERQQQEAADYARLGNTQRIAAINHALNQAQAQAKADAEEKIPLLSEQLMNETDPQKQAAINHAIKEIGTGRAAGVNELQDQLRSAESARYRALRYNPDFAENSGIPKNADLSKDIKLGYINGELYDVVDGTVVPRSARTGKGIDFGTEKNPWSFVDKLETLQYVTEDERATYNYLYNKEGEKSADKYLETLMPNLNARERAGLEEKATQWARENPLLASVQSVIASPGKAFSAVAQIADYITDGKADENAWYNRNAYVTDKARSTVGEYNAERTVRALESKGVSKDAAEWWGKAANFGYGTAMSMADFLFNAFITGGFNGGEGAAAKVAQDLSLAIMGAESSATAYISAKDRGLTDDQSILLSAIAGLAEVVTEKVSVENLFNETWEKQALKYFIKNVVSEGAEEGASDLINWTADFLIARDKNEWKTAFEEKKANNPNLSDKDAWKEVLKEKAVEIGLDILGGSLSGGVMAGGRISLGAIAKGVQNRQNRKSAQSPAQRQANTPETSNAGAVTTEEATDVSRLPTHLNIEELDADDGEDRTGRLNALIGDAADLTGDDRMEALGYLVSEMSDLYGEQAFERTIDYINERIQIDNQVLRTAQEENDTDTIEDMQTDIKLMKGLSNDLRNNRQAVVDAVAELQGEEEQTEEPGEQESISDDEWGLLPDDRYADRNMDEAELEFIHDADETFETTVTTIADAPADSTVNGVADLVTKVAETTEPDEDVIRATVDKVNEGIQTIDKVIDAVQNQYSPNLYAWLNSEETRRNFPMITDIQNRTPSNLLPSTTATYQEMKDNAPEAYRQYVLNELRVRRAVLEQIDSVLRNQKENVKQAVTDILTQSADRASTLTEGENNGTLEPAVGNTVVQADGESLAPQTPVVNETTTGEPKYTIRHEDFTHTKNGKKFDLIQYTNHLSKEDYKELKDTLEKFGGYWSPFKKGFLVPQGHWSEVESALRELNIGIADNESEVNNRVEPETPTVETKAETPVAGENSEIEVENQRESEKTEDTSLEKKSDTPYDILSDRLSVSKRVEMGNLVFEISGDNSGRYMGTIKIKPQDTGEYPIENARDTIYRQYYTDPNVTRADVVEDLVGVAENNKLLEPRETENNRPAENGKSVTAKTQKYNDIAKELKSKNNVNFTAVKPGAKSPDDFNIYTTHASANGRTKSGWIGLLKTTNEYSDYNPYPVIFKTKEFATQEEAQDAILEEAWNKAPWLFQNEEQKSKREPVAPTPKQTANAETVAETEAAPESEYAVGDVIEVGGEYYEVVAIENGEPQFEPYTSAETEAEESSAYEVGDIVAYNGKNYRIVEFADNGAPVLEEYRQPKNGGASNVRYALEAPERITLSLEDFNNAVKNNQIRKVSSTGARSSAPRPQNTTRSATPKPAGTQGTQRISLADLMKKGNTPINKITDKSKLGGIINGKRAGTAESGNRSKSGSGRSELGSESQRRDGGRTSDTVQEAEKEGGSETVSELSRKGGGRNGTAQSGTTDRNGNAGESVQNQEPVSAGESNTGNDERNNGKGNGGRATGNDDGGTGRRVSRLNKNNYSFDSEDVQYLDNTKPNVSDNLDAIRTLLDIERAGRKATAEEQKTLAKFKGWGGLADVFKYPGWGSGKELHDLLSPQEFEDARGSTINAHYTSLEIVNAMYDGLKRMGLKGGNILEPSMGSGNFFGAMPKAIANNSNLYGVEMDSITGRIAQKIYPDANITVAPFQNARYKDGQFDVVIGNVPFSKNAFTYKNEKHSLHDYFFVKSLDHLKDGGIMMAITSTGTMDKGNERSRNAIAEKADLIAAFRLPGGMFKTNAGTQVTTDLLVFRKRPAGLAQSGETFSGLGSVDVMDPKTGEVKKGVVNEYFIRHPENVLGTYVENTMYGKKEGDDLGSSIAVVPFKDANYRDILAEAMRRLPSKIIGTDMTAGEVKIENDSIKPGFIEQDGKMYFRDPSTDTTNPLSGKQADMARAYLKIRDAYNGIINLSNDPATPTNKLEQARKTLNTVYDSFADKFGYLNKGGNGGAKTFLRQDTDFSMVSSLEVKGELPGTFKKAPIFETNVFARPSVTHVDTPHDALAASIGERGKIDLDYMEKLSGIPREELLEKLEDRIVETPDGEYLLSELYLSGDVRRKLDEAKQAAESDSKFDKNVRMLEAVLPQTIPTENISVNIGASWIPESYYRDFALERLGAYQSVKIVHDKATGQWIVEGGKYAFPYYNTTYGDVDLRKMLESTMNQKQMQIRDENGKLDVAATQDAQQKQKLLRDEFSAWIFAAKARKAELGELYNRKFNSWRNADYTDLGKTLKFDGVNPLIKLRDYQRTAIARTVYNRDALLGHGVGTGKTFEMIASAMESKRLGITHKNLFVVPKNKVADFQSDILKLYPNARVMRVTDKDFEKANRAKMIAALATNDYDIAVIGHTQFAFIPMSLETQRAAIQEQLDEARAVLEDTKANGASKNSRSIKQIEKTIQGLKSQLEDLNNKKRDDTLTFEKLGVDGLFVDEAHNFKNLPFYTSLNVPGVKGGTAKRAMDMYMKTRWLHNQHSKIVFATATPITNSMSEIYNMTRFVSPDTLKEAGIDSFDAWASIFGEVTSALEVSPDGVNFRMKDRFAKFRNAQQMISMFRQFTDVIKTADVVKSLPKVNRITVTCAENDLTREYVNGIVERIDRMKGRASKKDNMLLITSDGKAAATDLRLVAKQLNGQDNPDLIYIPGFERYSMNDLDLPDSKINQTVKNVLQEYKDTSDVKGTQLIFLDQGLTSSGDARYGFDLYSDIINKLIKGGIKAEEIVRIDKVPIKKLDDLFDKMRSGEVRVLIGTTMRMGEGLNIQDRIVAMHEITPPAKPSGIEQSEGRAIRDGNMNKEVRIYRYIQEGSFDSYLWQQLERKGRFINVAMSGGEVNEIDDVDDFVLSAQEAKALATGNPLLLEKAELDAKFNDLSAAHRVYMSQQMGAQDIVANAPNELNSAKKLLEARKADAETIKDNPVEDGKISITIDGKEYTDRKSANDAIKKVLGNNKYALNRTYEIGSVRGLALKFLSRPHALAANGLAFDLSLNGKSEYHIPDVFADGDNATRIWNQIKKIESGEYVTPVEDRVGRIQTELDEAKALLKQGFKRQEEYDTTLARLKEVNTQLAMAAGGVGAEIIDTEDSDLKGNFKTEEELYEDELEVAAEASDEEDEGGEQKPKRKSTTRKSLFEGRWDTERVNPANGPLSASQIQRAAGRIFNLPINTGKVNYRATGIYDERAVAARIKTHGDIPNLCHEIGHYMDSLYEFSDSKEIEPVISEFENDLTAAGYTEEQIPGEAFAEFFRIYCKNKGDAAKQFEDFTEYFENALSPADKKRMEAFSGITHDYFSAVNRTRIEANVGARTERLRPSVKLNEAIDEIKSDPKGAFRAVEHEAVRQWVDDLTELRPFGNAYDKAYYEKQARSIAEGRLTIAMTDMQGNIIGDSMGTILERGRITAENRKAFDSYLVLCRAYDQYNNAREQGAKDPLIFADKELNNRMEIAKQIQLYERDNPTFHDTAGELYAYQQQLLDLCVEGGLMTEEFKDKLNDLYPHYVPLYRVMDDQKSVLGVKGKYADQKAPIARFKGSGREIWSPLENIMMNVEKITAATMRNDVMREFAHTIDTVSGLGHIATRVTPDMAVQRVMTDSLKNKLATLLGENANLFGSENELLNFTHLVFGEIGDVLTQWAPSAKQSRNIVSVMRDGQRTYYEVHDEGVLKSLKAMNREEMGVVARTLTAIGRAQKALFTSFSPKFNVNNFARDTMTGLISSTATNNAFKYMGDAVKAFKDVITDSPAFKQYRLHGGGYMNSLTYDSGTMRNIMDELLGSKGRLKNIWDTFMRIYTASEDVTRYAEYKRNLAQGKSVMDAIRASQEISVNFARGGETGKKLNRYFLFLNAQIQGEYHIADMIKNGTKSQKAKMILYPMAASVLQWMLGLIVMPFITGKKKEELIDDYANLSNYHKLNYYNIPLGNGKFFQVRKTQDFALPESLIELYVLNAMDKNAGEWNDVAEYTMEQIFPLNKNSISNFVGVGPLLDVKMNESYTGAPIVPDYLKTTNTPGELQYTPGSTSKVAIKLGEITGVSPNVIQYLGEEEFGFPARLLNDLTRQDGDWKNGLNNFKFIADSVYSTDIINVFYDQKEKYDTGARGYKMGSKKYTLTDVYGNNKYGKIASLYSDLNAARKEESDPAVARTMKAQINALFDTINKDGLTDVDEKVIALCERTGTSPDDIAPYVTIPDTVPYKPKSEKTAIKIPLNYEDHYNFFLQISSKLERDYKTVLSSGYSDADLVDVLKKVKSEAFKEMKEEYGEKLYKTGRR